MAVSIAIARRGTLLSLALWCSGTAEEENLARGDEAKVVESLHKAITSNNDEAIEEAHESLLELVNAHPDRLDLQLAAVEGYVARADLLRVQRHTGDLDSDTDDAYRDQQAEWGELGVAHANLARELAEEKRQISEALRLKGEATVHRISGPINGFRFGPVAKAVINEALRVDPDNPEAMRAIGLMYLHNPPLNGGDLDEAVATFKRCAELKNNDIAHALLAHAWWKKERPERALLEAKLALARNPNNRLAKNIKARVSKEEVE